MTPLSLQVFSRPVQVAAQHSPDPSRGQRYVVLLERRGIVAPVKLASQLLVPASIALSHLPSNNHSSSWTDIGDGLG